MCASGVFCETSRLTSVCTFPLLRLKEDNQHFVPHLEAMASSFIAIEI